MIDLSIDRDLEARLDQVRRLGREHLRPLGIEADRQREPVPPDHRFFALAWRMGIGQPLGVEERPAAGPRIGTRRGVVLAEEMSYWDRGMSVAMPGLGLGGPPLLSMGTDWIVVWATVDRAAGRAGHRAFIVERGRPGLEDMRYEHKMGLIAYESSSFTLRDCRVPAANLLGGERHYAERAGFKGAMKSFNATRPAIAAMAVGIGCARSSRAWRGRSRRAGSSAGARRTWRTWSSRTRSRPRWRKRSRPAWRRRRPALRSRSWATRASPPTPTSRSSTAT